MFQFFSPFSFVQQPQIINSPMQGTDLVFAKQQQRENSFQSPFIQQNRKSPKGSDAFRASILLFIDTVERRPNSTYLISEISNRFGFQRRRFYDVINVLEAVGCCQKANVDAFLWLGLSNVKNTLKKIGTLRGIFSYEQQMEQIFECIPIVTISKLTQDFVLSFIALNKRVLDIKQISTFLSRNNGRFKTVLCKLYQISHILEIVGIIGKTAIPGEVTLRADYFPDSVPITKQKENTNCTKNLLEIENLLNKPNNNTIETNIYDIRWEEFSRFQETPPVQSPISTSVSIGTQIKV